VNTFPDPMAGKRGGGAGRGMMGRTDFDVVVIGSGLAGLATALAARVLGLSAVVLEKENCVGGGSSWSMGAIWVGANDLARDAGLFDDTAAVTRYMDVIAGGEGEPDRIRAFIDNAPSALNFFRSCGIPFELVLGAGDHLYGKANGSLPHGRTLETPAFDGRKLGPWRIRLSTPPGSAWRVSLGRSLAARNGLAIHDQIQRAIAQDDLCLGVGLVAHFLHQLTSKDVPVETGVSAAALIMQSGRIIGAETQDGRRFIGRRATVIATGGYESNATLAAQLENLPGHQSMFGPGLCGDGLSLGAAAGGAVWKIQNNLMVMLGDKDPRASAGAAFRTVSNTELPNPHGLVVNRFGCRFGDEASFQLMAPALRKYDAVTRAHINLPCWLVFDQQYVDQFGYGGCPPGQAPDWILKDPDLSSLARRAKIDPDGLIDTIAAFNVDAAQGIDRVYGRGATLWSLIKPRGKGPNPSLGSIEKPPFYAVELYPAAMSSAGLRTDAHARVRDWRGNTISGLYAVGNAAAHTEYGVGYQAGHSLASAMTFGFLAAHDISRDHLSVKETKVTTIYTATVTTTGGREGRAQASDGKLDVTLSMPKEFGGPGGSGTNPEQLFAAGYSACFESVLRMIARQQKKTLTDASVTAHVNVHPLEQGFGLSAALEIKVSGLAKEEVEEMARLAHTICPYSNATRGNIDVKITVV
jgi:3-oxosteroid 1-dehydrogenase